MIFQAILFDISDIIVGPICFIILLMVFSAILNKYKDEKIKKILLRAFYFKMFCTLAYTATNSFYYRGGDTEMYYQCTQYLHQAVMDDVDNFAKIYSTKMINVKTDLMNYFIFQETKYPVFEAMHDPGNFLAPKLALPFSLMFNKSYLCIGMMFSFFALGGAVRMFKVFYHYFPQYYREIAFACLFLPSLGYWSSGLMKDPICFGAVGYILYGVFSIAIRKKKIITSLIWIGLCGTLLYFMKVYILLGLSPGIVLWLFGEFNKFVENKTLRRIMAFLTFTIGAVLALVLVNYATSDESIKQFRLDSISETSEQQRLLYEEFGQNYEGAYYSIGSSNPLILVLNGIVATLFRPFIWEINGPTAFLSALESLLFFILTITTMYRRGFLNFFRNAFKNPVLLMCFVFSIIFAAAIGSTALNFGSLSRYKIPCLPFYLIMIFVLYREGGLEYPNWFKKFLGYRTYLARDAKKEYKKAI